MRWINRREDGVGMPNENRLELNSESKGSAVLAMRRVDVKLVCGKLHTSAVDAAEGDRPTARRVHSSNINRKGRRHFTTRTIEIQ